MPDDLKTRLVNELADAPQGKRDAQMPPPPDPTPGGQVGPSPSADAIPDNIYADTDVAPEGTGEEPDAGQFNAGGVDVRNTDGMTRTEAGRD